MKRSEYFYHYGAYGEPDGELQMDYFFWAIVGDGETILVDTGFHPSAAARRPGRTCLVPPVKALADVGIDRHSVSLVIVTHLHYDHIGNLASFPDARVVLQKREIDFWAGPHGMRSAVVANVEVSEIEYIESVSKKGGVQYLEGDGTIAPNIRAKLVGGHCPGEQVIIVDSSSPVVLASDALHYYEEMERYMPGDVFSDLEETYATYDLLRQLEERDGAVVVAGHDPAVMERFPALEGVSSGLAVRVR